MTNRTYWDEKPYYSLNYYLKQTFGEKVYKLSLDGGMTCPNRDGKLGCGGCIFCSAGGSGDFSAKRQSDITAQIKAAKETFHRYGTQKQVGTKFIAYFQSYTNTYGEVDYLRELFTAAIQQPEIVALSIATRPDCLSSEILDLLDELNQIKPVWIELGLQTIHEHTATFIRRGYQLSCFEEAVANLRKRHLTVIVHLILGLPFETESEMLQTIQYIAKCDIQGVKLQLLHVLKNTDLAKHLTEFHIYTLEEYTNLLLRCIEHLPKDMVIHRITGDGPKDLLLAPLWSSNKKYVLNYIHKAMKEQQSWQGKYYQEGLICNPIH